MGKGIIAIVCAVGRDSSNKVTLKQKKKREREREQPMQTAEGNEFQVARTGSGKALGWELA